jgi:hypothetical protein
MSAISSVSQLLPPPSAAPATQNAGQAKQPSAESGQDSVQLSDTAQAKIAESGSGCH